jgi:steroid 5-alpha reductase family enzyme
MQSAKSAKSAARQVDTFFVSSKSFWGYQEWFHFYLQRCNIFSLIHHHLLIGKIGKSYMLKNSTTHSIIQENWKESRTFGFVIISFCYLIALMIGLKVYNSAGQSVWLNILLGDLAATIVIWVCSLLLSNASVYDPYWSIQPMVILPLLVLQAGFYIISILLCAVVFIWGARLTANWALTFRGLHQQDWRYDQIKSNTGSFYPFINLLGIQLMPTLVVFACIAPIIFVVEQSPEFSWMILPGILVSLAGLVLETTADRQLKDFHSKDPGKAAIIREGLWKYSRHPNYLGEIMMWWGMYLACLFVYPSAWKLGLGALINTALFLFISIPMAEKRLAEYKEGYLEYQRQTRMLLPLPKKAR